MATTGEPLSEERLAEIRASLEQVRARVRDSDADSTSPAIPTSTIFMAMNAVELLREVERYRAREAALLAVMERVAETGADFDMNTGNSWLLFPGLYAAEQCREQARALLASADETIARPADAPGRE